MLSNSFVRWKDWTKEIRLKLQAQTFKTSTQYISKILLNELVLLICNSGLLTCYVHNSFGFLWKHTFLHITVSVQKRIKYKKSSARSCFRREMAAAASYFPLLSTVMGFIYFTLCSKRFLCLFQTAEDSCIWQLLSCMFFCMGWLTGLDFKKKIFFACLLGNTRLAFCMILFVVGKYIQTIHFLGEIGRLFLWIIAMTWTIYLSL